MFFLFHLLLLNSVHFSFPFPSLPFPSPSFSGLVFPSIFLNVSFVCFPFLTFAFLSVPSPLLFLSFPSFTSPFSILPLPFGVQCLFFRPDLRKWPILSSFGDGACQSSLIAKVSKLIPCPFLPFPFLTVSHSPKEQCCHLRHLWCFHGFPLANFLCNTALTKNISFHRNHSKHIIGKVACAI